MIDPDDPLKDGLTPPDYDEYGDVPDSGENADDSQRVTSRTREKARWDNACCRHARPT